jgi:hypothetical protein
MSSKHSCPVTAINHEATGYSPRICDQLQRICRRLMVGDANTAELAAELKLKPKGHAIWDSIGAGVTLRILTVRKHWDGGPGGRRPDVVSIDRVRLHELACRDTALPQSFLAAQRAVSPGV